MDRHGLSDHRTVIYPPMVSRRGVKFVASWESFSKYAVDLEGRGILTIGYGTTSLVKPVHVGDKITKRKARRWLREILEEEILPKIPHVNDLKQNEIDALASAAYNLGPGFLTDTKNSTFARRMRSGEGTTTSGRRRIVKEELPRWNEPGSPFEEGLTRRRDCEKKLFLYGRYLNNH